MKLTVLAAFAALAFSSSADAKITNLVMNGDFTQLTHGVGELDRNTSATGWNTTAYNFVVHNATNADAGASIGLWTQGNGWNGLTASGDGNFLALDGAYFTGPISQTVKGLTIGKSYTLSFDYAFAQQTGFDGDTIQDLTATIGSTIWKSSDFNLPNHGFSGWTTNHLSFTADNTSEVLSFLAHGNLPVPPFALVSNVSIPGAVPEAQVWAMMILGLGAVGMTMRHRRAAMLVAA